MDDFNSICRSLATLSRVPVAICVVLLVWPQTRHGMAAPTVTKNQSNYAKIVNHYARLAEYMDSGRLNEVEKMLSAEFCWTDTGGPTHVGKASFLDLMRMQIDVGRPDIHSFKVKSVIKQTGFLMASVNERLEWSRRGPNGKLIHTYMVSEQTGRWRITKEGLTYMSMDYLRVESLLPSGKVKIRERAAKRPR